MFVVFCDATVSALLQAVVSTSIPCQIIRQRRFLTSNPTGMNMSGAVPRDSITVSVMVHWSFYLNDDVAPVLPVRQRETDTPCYGATFSILDLRLFFHPDWMYANVPFLPQSLQLGFNPNPQIYLPNNTSVITVIKRPFETQDLLQHARLLTFLFGRLFEPELGLFRQTNAADGMALAVMAPINL
ncbi:hypothetical protein F2P81_006022 [Scophthalmus maximus]|uniref:Uncharacterized protein n=1 Tax=Scophthalmus maximus TaxID=52904 RepID=A0A6A4TFG2_SCOMX|nr:hypothetical protein F2P81_006022 [Scophthalmus maximus]